MSFTFSTDSIKIELPRLSSLIPSNMMSIPITNGFSSPICSINKPISSRLYNSFMSTKVIRSSLIESCSECCISKNVSVMEKFFKAVAIGFRKLILNTNRPIINNCANVNSTMIKWSTWNILFSVSLKYNLQTFLIVI